MVAPFVLEGAVNGQIFLSYARQCLVPTLERGVVILDNVPIHKVAGVKEAIEAVGATFIYLPSYSPDFDPIEPAFSKVKEHLRKAAGAHHSKPHASDLSHCYRFQRRRMQELLSACRVCSNVTGIRSS